MPRDLRTYKARRCVRRSASTFRSNSQVSMSEETPTSLCCSAASPLVRLVNSAVICLVLEEVNQPRDHRFDL